MLWKKRDRGRENVAAVLPPADARTEPAFLAPVSSPATLRSSLGPDTSVTGRLSFTAPTRLDGKLRGEVHSSDLLVIGETAIVDGTVRGSNVVVLGSVDGQVFASERLEIGACGRLKGALETRELVVHEGGKLDGSCRITPAKANVVFLRPRADIDDEVGLEAEQAAVNPAE